MVNDPLFLVIIGSILFLLFIGVLGNWQLAGRIHHLKRGLQQFASKESEWDRGAPSYEMVGEMIEEYKKQRMAGVEEINSQALIERHYNRLVVRVMGIFPISVGGWERFISFLSASMVMLGLLGTFVGLTFALFGMQNVLTGLGGNPELSVHNIVSAISQPFDGMSIAFLTSICGIGASLLLSLFTSGLLGSYLGPNTTQLKAELLTECEDFLDNHYLVYVESQKPKGSMEELMERLAGKLRESFDHSIAAFATAIQHTTARIDDSVGGINQMVEQQQKIIHIYDQGATQLVKFGVAMEKTVQTLVENHKDTAAQMERLGGQVEQLNGAIHTLGEKTVDSSRSLEALIRSSNQILEDERKSNERIVQLFGERWNQISQAQKALLDSIASMQKQMEESVRSSASQVQQYGAEMQARTREQWEELRREWQAQIEQGKRMEQETQQQLLRQIEQIFAKIDATMQQNNRGALQNLQQSYTELGRMLRQLEEIGQKNMESHRVLIERLPTLSRAAEEFSRSIDNMERQQGDFLERFRREISSLMSQAQERERKNIAPTDSTRELREMAREFEAIRALLEREFRESHRFTSEIAHLVEAIYETGRSSIRRNDPQLMENRAYGRGERVVARDEGYRR